MGRARKAADARPAPPSDGFEYLTPWIPSRNYDGFYMLGIAPKHGRMYRWRFIRKHETPPGQRPMVSWYLDESVTSVEPSEELLATADQWDDPRVMSRPRDRSEATAIVLKRWDAIQRAPQGQVPPCL